MTTNKAERFRAAFLTMRHETETLRARMAQERRAHAEHVATLTRDVERMRLQLAYIQSSSGAEAIIAGLGQPVDVAGLKVAISAAIETNRLAVIAAENSRRNEAPN